ncbi:MAG: CotH kinase family protein [Verrucomicrobiales bacterium]|nr:CotH kinase family protein [Verrucomicrobiales bacterium]
MTSPHRDARASGPRPGSWLLALVVCLRGLLGSDTHAQGMEAEDPFTARAVWPVAIELSARNVEKLRSDAKQYVPATVHALDRVAENTAIKLKGHGSFQPIDEKPSFTVNFTKYAPDRTVAGLTKIHLNNSAHDTSYLREQIATELFLAAGVPAPRVTHAWVRLNDRTLGLYVVKEGCTRDFVRRHFASGEGNLYDDDAGHDIDQRMDRDLAGEPGDDQAELQRLAAATREPDLDRRWQRLQATLDVPRFLRFMAMELMLGHWDGYCLGQNNFRVYHDPVADRIVFLPSGMDQVFAKADAPWRADMSGLVARAVLETPEGGAQYEATFRALFEEVFDSERIIGRVNARLKELQPGLDAGTFAELEQQATALGGQIVARERWLETQLNVNRAGPPTFEEGTASLDGWTAFNPPANGSLSAGRAPDSRRILRIVAGDRTAASWRTTLRLKPGCYRFQGRARAVGVVALPFGKHHGAGLRVAGREEISGELTGTTGWKPLEIRFEATEAEEEVRLICELRASAGEAWFDRDSLYLVRER